MNRKRKRYETFADLENEKQIADIAMGFFGCNSATKLGEHYGADYAFANNLNLICFAEIKKRRVPHTAYETIFVSAYKRLVGLNLETGTGRRSYFIVGFNDGVYGIPWRALPEKITIGGRTDRNNNLDIEPLVHYKISNMFILRKYNDV